MRNSAKFDLLLLIGLALSTAVAVCAFFAVADDLLAGVWGITRPYETGFGFWHIVPLSVVALGAAFIADRLRFAVFGALVSAVFGIWFIASALAAAFLDIDLLFVEGAIVTIAIAALIQVKKVWRLESKLGDKLVSLTSNSYLLEGKDADSRVESGLQLLRTLLQLSEVIVFQYEADGQLNPVGRTRSGGIHESLSTRQNSWRKNIELCERALETEQTVVEVDESEAGSARIALPLITDNVLVGGLFVNVEKNYERNDIHLLEAFSEQLARNFQKSKFESRSKDRGSWKSPLSTESHENKLNLVNLANGLIKEQSFGVLATSHIKEAHAIAYLDGTIAYLNRQMRNLAKIDPDQIHQINLFDLLARFKTDVFNEPSMAIRRVMQTGSTFQSELVFPEDEITLDMEITLVNVATNPDNVHDTAVTKKPACFLITFRDITPRKENEKLRSDMVNLMSHELRTPITSIQGFAEMLVADKNIPEESREYLTTIANESQRAAKLLSNFLSVANLQQQDKQEFHKSPVRVNTVVKEVVDQMQDQAKRKRIRLVERQGDYIPPVAADRGLMTKAISHLVENALKYSPERTSVVVSTLLESDFLKVEVEDRGYGIPAAEQEKIWQKFYRVARDGQDKEEESTGLGLSLVKEIVEQHSGTVGVESVVGRGSKFSFRIPRL